MSDIPTAVSTKKIVLLGVEVTAHVLDDGRTVIEEDDMFRLIEMLTATTEPPA